jgi:hypothetical protein
MFPRRIPSTALLPTVVTALALVSAPWGARPAAAQTATLGSPTAEYLEGLSFVQSLREMPD